MEFIIQTIGFCLLFWAVDIGRTPECRIGMFSRNWFKTFMLILVGVLLIRLSVDIPEIREKHKVKT